MVSALAAASPQIRSLRPDVLPEKGPHWIAIWTALGDGAGVASWLASTTGWRLPERPVRARCRTEPDFAVPLAETAVALGGEAGYRVLRMLDPAPEHAFPALASLVARAGP